MVARSARSSAGSRTCCVSSAGQRRGPGMIEDRFNSRPANAAGRSSQARRATGQELASPAARRAPTRSHSCCASACSSSVRTNTCSLMKQCRRQGARQRQDIVVVLCPGAIRNALEQDEAHAGQKALKIDIRNGRAFQEAAQQWIVCHGGKAVRARTTLQPAAGAAMRRRHDGCNRPPPCSSLISFAAAGASSLARPHGLGHRPHQQGAELFRCRAASAGRAHTARRAPCSPASRGWPSARCSVSSACSARPAARNVRARLL